MYKSGFSKAILALGIMAFQSSNVWSMDRNYDYGFGFDFGDNSYKSKSNSVLELGFYTTGDDQAPILLKNGYYDNGINIRSGRDFVRYLNNTGASIDNIGYNGKNRTFNLLNLSVPQEKLVIKADGMKCKEVNLIYNRQGFELPVITAKVHTLRFSGAPVAIDNIESEDSYPVKVNVENGLYFRNKGWAQKSFSIEGANQYVCVC